MIALDGARSRSRAAEREEPAGATRSSRTDGRACFARRARSTADPRRTRCAGGRPRRLRSPASSSIGDAPGPGVTLVQRRPGSTVRCATARRTPRSTGQTTGSPPWSATCRRCAPTSSTPHCAQRARTTAFVPDAAGTGTTLLPRGPGMALDPGSAPAQPRGTPQSQPARRRPGAAHRRRHCRGSAPRRPRRPRRAHPRRCCDGAVASSVQAA